MTIPFQEHKIVLLRTNEDLLKLLPEKQVALKKAQQKSEQLKKGKDYRY